MMDLWEMCISNLPGSHKHYEKLNHEMSVLKKFTYHLLKAIRLKLTILPSHEIGV
jgi:hypothetical protein